MLLIQTGGNGWVHIWLYAAGPSQNSRMCVSVQWWILSLSPLCSRLMCFSIFVRNNGAVCGSEEVRHINQQLTNKAAGWHRRELRDGWMLRFFLLHLTLCLSFRLCRHPSSPGWRGQVQRSDTRAGKEWQLHIQYGYTVYLVLQLETREDEEIEMFFLMSCTDL